MNEPKALGASASTTQFPNVVEVQNQLKKDRDTYLYATEAERLHELLLVVGILSNKLSEESTALDSLNWQYAFKRFVILTGVSESISFSATIPYDSALLNDSGTLAAGRWHVHFDRLGKTLEVSTESFR